jgi:hypothetical protein
MIELPILHGLSTLPLWRRCKPLDLSVPPQPGFREEEWEISGNTLIDDFNYTRFKDHRWHMMRSPTDGTMQVGRLEFKNMRGYWIQLAREVLGLPRVVIGGVYRVKNDKVMKRRRKPKGRKRRRPD